MFFLPLPLFPYKSSAPTGLIPYVIKILIFKKKVVVAVSTSILISDFLSRCTTLTDLPKNNCYCQCVIILAKYKRICKFIRRGIRFAHMGPCLNTTAVEEACPTDCDGAIKDGPICASNGNVYSSTCEMKLLTCGY